MFLDRFIDSYLLLLVKLDAVYETCHSSFQWTGHRCCHFLSGGVYELVSLVVLAEVATQSQSFRQSLGALVLIDLHSQSLPTHLLCLSGLC